MISNGIYMLKRKPKKQTKECTVLGNFIDLKLIAKSYVFSTILFFPVCSHMLLLASSMRVTRIFKKKQSANVMPKSVKLLMILFTKLLNTQMTYIKKKCLSLINKIV